MKAVLMAGGFGTRLRPLTCNIPKPMVPVMNRPMMEYIVELLRRHGITDIVVLLYYQPHIIRNHFGDGSAFGVNIEYVQAEADFGTAGSVRNAAARIGNERFLIISGDVLTNFDLTAAIEFHENAAADITMILTHVANPLSFGIVMTDEQNHVTRFLEKPSWGGVFSDTVNTGIYIIEPHILDLIPYKQEFDFSRQLFPDMLSSGFGLYGFVADGYWRDIGNLHEYHEAHLDFLMGKIDLRHGEGKDRERNSALTSAQHGRNRVGEGTSIAQTAVVSNSVVGRNCKIGEGVRAHNVIIWDEVEIEDEVEITNSVVCSRTVIHDRALVSDNVFIGERCIVGSGAKLMSNIKVWPEKVIQDDAVLSKSLVWEDKWLRELFTEARVTGRTNVEINPEFAARLGAALGAMVGTTRPVIASRDMSVASRMIKRSIAAGLMSMGCSVTDLQIMPIPLVRQELRSGKHAAGFHVRCSPYDATKTDIVFFDGAGRDLPLSERKSIERLFFGEDYMRAKFNAIGNLRFPERTPEMYRDRFLASIDSAVIRDAKFSLVINYSHGISSTLFPAILGDFKCQVVSLDAYLDMQNLARNPDEFWEDYRQVGEIVSSLRYDAGFLLDVGAEKIFMTDEKGNLLYDQRLLTLVTKLYLETTRMRGMEVKQIAVPIDATSEVDLVAWSYDVEVLRTTGTHAGMMSAIFSNDDVTFVGGTRGGFIFRDFHFAVDAMFSVAKILEMLAVVDIRPGALELTLPRLYRDARSIPCTWDVKGRIMRKAMQASSAMHRILVDGIKIIFDEATWVLLRPDSSDPVFHIIAEAPDQDKASELVAKYSENVGIWKEN